MNEHQKDLLVSLFEKKIEATSQIDHPYSALIHAVFNTVDFERLVGDYIENDIPEFSDSMYNNIEKRIPNYNNHEKMYDDLNQLLESGTDYRKSQRLRKILELQLSQLPNDYKIDFFYTFFNSDYSYDKRAAIRYVEFAQTDVTEKLLDEYLSSGYVDYLNLLIKPENANILAKNAEDIWETELYHSHKKRIIEICATENLDFFDFLQAVDYSYYLLLLIIRKEIEPEVLMEKLEELDAEQQHFALLHFSKWIDFSFVEEKVKQYI
ncbi:hypothetical protein LPB85_12895 [Chryseobacterium sp. LC2016-27]|uniref:hypothetical protein n=1 Tax=Chryseobacterium sp. LC2016-27 TaxID=2897326 RepID=UPI001E5A1054|nr:hypothetical protein [Chryseobacterium sp. LC2016-27]MCD0456335.1 hypothetical protein [Chryseobacterium sp. LC2016-27]